MSDENPLDAAFRMQQLQFEREQAPVRREFDSMVRAVLASQALREHGFGADLSDSELTIYRDVYTITAHLAGQTIEVSISKDGATNYERSSFGSLCAGFRNEDKTSADGAIRQIGSFMARIVEERLE